jgi:hypothetical protein
MLAEYYEGSFGVDTLIYRDGENRLRINPCLEINVRQNMGFLSLQLEKLLIPGKKAVFNLFFQKGKSFKAFSTEMQEKYPVQFNENRLADGFFPSPLPVKRPCSELIYWPVMATHNLFCTI